MTTSIKKTESQILLPSYIIKKNNFNLSKHLAKHLVINIYNSIGEIEIISKVLNFDLIFIEDRFFFEKSFSKIKKLSSGIILIETGIFKKPSYNPDEILGLITKNKFSIELLNFTIENSLAKLVLKRENINLKKNIKKQEQKFVELHDIGISLSKENDIDSLLETIISKSMQLTCADGGCLFLLENIPTTNAIDDKSNSNNHIRPIFLKNISRKIKTHPKNTINLSEKSICGNVIQNGEPILIEDVSKLTEEVRSSWNQKQIDEIYKYRVKSILTVPILNIDKLVIGAIQLVNRKRNFDTILLGTKSILKNVIPFEKRDLYFLESIASQASVALGNTNLIKSVHILFDGFINASVRAIESRDPTTSGHSSRVAILTLAIAETINHINTGRFANEKFNNDHLDEIRYASLLHDFGKIGIRERVLVKSKKLYPDEFNLLIDRFRLIKTLIELNTSKKQISYLLEESKEKALDKYKKSKMLLCEKLEELDEFQKFIIDSNEPIKLENDEIQKLNNIAKQTYQYPKGVLNNYLSDLEVCSLSTKKGSLNDLDRREIESHVTHTYNFLKIIPWTKNLERVPVIAYAHHEKINGKGYPLKLKENEIPLESKMMTIADIYDALTAWDRPYKNAIPSERALDILFFEAEENHLDRDLLDIFVNSKIYNLVKHTK